jgi:prevent-host-death family protein
MTNSVGIRELRQHARSILKRVSRGETIEVTDHGHPVARIIPIRPGILEQLMLEGRATESEHDLLDLLDEMSLPAPSLGSRLPSEALGELRAGEE